VTKAPTSASMPRYSQYFY